MDGTAINVDDYTISYSNSNGETGENANKTAGTVTITIEAKSSNAKYKGSTTKNFTIVKAEPDIAGEISAQQRKYQEYLNRNGNKPATENHQDTSPAHSAAGKKQLSPMAQAVMWSEILGRPKALYRKK